MGRKRKILPAEVVAIKEMLWNGTPQGDIADHYGISQASVSRIQTGDQWADIRWPDGSSGALPIEREQQIIAQRFPGVALRGLISNALRSGQSVGDIARRVSGEVELLEEKEEEQNLSSLMMPDTGEREEVEMPSEQIIRLITAKQWSVFKQMFPAHWWKDIPNGDRIKQTAVHYVLTAQGAEDLPAKEVHRQITEVEQKIKQQQEGE